MFPTPPAPTAELTPLFILEATYKDVTVCAKISAIDKPAEIFVEAIPLAVAAACTGYIGLGITPITAGVAAKLAVAVAIALEAFDII